MNNKDLKKLALLGITGGVVLSGQGQINASENTLKGYNADELLAYRSWTCRSETCVHGHHNHESHSQSHSQSHQSHDQSNQGSAEEAVPAGVPKPAQNNAIESDSDQFLPKLQSYQPKGGNYRSTVAEANRQQNLRAQQEIAENEAAPEGKEVKPVKESVDSNGCGGRNGCGGHQKQGITPDEDRFVSQLSPENRRIYDKMNPDAKALALRLSKQYSDKNTALKMAFKQSNKEQIQKQIGQSGQQEKRRELYQ